MKGCGDRLAKTEVHQLCARFGEHDVAGLQITMDDALTMSFIESIGDFHAYLQRQRRGGEDRHAIGPREFSPSKYSMTMKAVPSCEPMSYRQQTLGCVSEETARASRSKRCFKSGSRRKVT